jgi:hypothetical protein
LSQANENRAQGKIFEDLFLNQARRLGFYAKKHELACRYVGQGRLQPIKSDLDFKIIADDGRVGFFDCKSYGAEKFSFSEIDPQQMKLAYDYNAYKVPAGFVVWFRTPNAVVYFSGSSLVKKGSGCSFTTTDGQYLGRFERFNLKAIFL